MYDSYETFDKLHDFTYYDEYQISKILQWGRNWYLQIFHAANSGECLEFTCLVLHCRLSGRRHFAASILKQPAPELPTPVLTVPASPPTTPTPGAGRSSKSDKHGFLQFSKWHLSPCLSCSIYHFGFKRLSTSNCKKDWVEKKPKLSKIIDDNQSKD